MKCMTRTMLATLAAALLSEGAKATTEEVGGMTYEYTIADGKATITKATGNNKVISVPDTLGGAKVTTLGAGSFKDNTIVEQVVLPESVTTFEYDRGKGGVFERCDMLTSINIPNGVTKISSRCFKECVRLANVNLPSGLKAICCYAFGDCWALESINFPEGLEVIGCGAFASCRSLLNVDLPDSVISLEDKSEGPYAYLSSGAFGDCKSLKTVRLSKSVKKIPYCCFEFCDKLASLNIPEGVTEIGPRSIRFCKSLSEVILPSGLIAIGDEAFDNHQRYLAELHLPASVKSVGNGSFRGVGRVIVHGPSDGQPPAGLAKSGLSLISYVND